MLKSVRHIDILDLSKENVKDKFLFRQKRIGHIIPRRFTYLSRYVCIFETTQNIHAFPGFYHEIKELLNIDQDWIRCIEDVSQVNFKIRNEIIEEVVNFFKSDYRYGIMLIFKDNFKEEYCKKFWKMCDIYLSNIYKNHRLKNKNEIIDEYSYLYNKHILNESLKRESLFESDRSNKRARSDSYSSVVSDVSLNQSLNSVGSQMQPILEYQTPVLEAQPAILDPRLRIQRDLPQNSMTQNVVSDPRLRRSSIVSTPEVPSLNSSFGSNSGILNQLHDISQASVTNYTIIKMKYDELKGIKDKCYRDATAFKKRLVEADKKAKELEHKYNTLKNQYEVQRQQFTKVVTELNRRNINVNF